MNSLELTQQIKCTFLNLTLTLPTLNEECNYRQTTIFAVMIFYLKKVNVVVGYFWPAMYWTFVTHDARCAKVVHVAHIA